MQPTIADLPTFPGVMGLTFLHDTISRWGVAQLEPVHFSDLAEMFGVSVFVRQIGTWLRAKVARRAIVPRRDCSIFVAALFAYNYHGNIIGGMQA